MNVAASMFGLFFCVSRQFRVKARIIKMQNNVFVNNWTIPIWLVICVRFACTLVRTFCREKCNEHIMLISAAQFIPNECKNRKRQKAHEIRAIERSIADIRYALKSIWHFVWFTWAHLFWGLNRRPFPIFNAFLLSTPRKWICALERIDSAALFLWDCERILHTRKCH